MDDLEPYTLYSLEGGTQPAEVGATPQAAPEDLALPPPAPALPAAPAGNWEVAHAPAVAPFVIELVRQDVGPNGYFRPDALLLVTSALRTSGLLAALPAEELKSLLAVLSFLTPNGDVMPTLPQVAQALEVSEGTARARLGRLLAFSWQGEPLVRHVPRANGLDAYLPSPAVVAVRHRADPPRESSPPLQVAGRDRVIARSRSLYTRPRAEVERMIAELNGWDVPEAADGGVNNELRTLRIRLTMAGMAKDEADGLLAAYPAKHIARQLDYLPYRHAKNPARYLAAAIVGDYDPPRGLPPHLVSHEGDLAEDRGPSADLLAEDLPASPEDQSK